MKADEVMCFGHAPHMDQLIASRRWGARRFYGDEEGWESRRWNLNRCGAGKATLLWILTPKIARQIE